MLITQYNGYRIVIPLAFCLVPYNPSFPYAVLSPTGKMKAHVHPRHIQADHHRRNAPNEGQPVPGRGPMTGSSHTDWLSLSHQIDCADSTC